MAELEIMPDINEREDTRTHADLWEDQMTFHHKLKWITISFSAHKTTHTEIVNIIEDLNMHTNISRLFDLYILHSFYTSTLFITVLFLL